MYILYYVSINIKCIQLFGVLILWSDDGDSLFPRGSHIVRSYCGRFDRLLHHHHHHLQQVGDWWWLVDEELWVVAGG